MYHSFYCLVYLVISMDTMYCCTFTSEINDYYYLPFLISDAPCSGIDYTFFLFFFRLFLSGVAKADFPSPVVSINCILLRHFTTSINLPFGLPRFLFPGNSILSILIPIYPSSFLRRCPYHLNLACRVFSPKLPTCAVPLMY